MRIAINGFGRIGRIFLRQIFGLKGIEITAINDLGNLENLAYLLKYDSVYRNYNREVSFDNNQGFLLIDNQKIKFLQEKDPAKLPWSDLQIDLVIEATGFFESYEQARAHLSAGAKRVVLTAPAKDLDGDLGKTVLMGINDEVLGLDTIVITSNASCTTNSISPVVTIMAENPGIVKAVLNTVHSYTNTQTLVDAPVRGNDFRRGRAGAQNIIPSTTGAAIAVTRAIKELEGKFDGIALRVPVVTGSLADITFLAKRKTSVEELQSILRQAAQDQRWQGILKVVDEPIVSSDIIGEPYGAIVDLQFIRVIDGDLVKILSWYDNEWGYVATLVKHVLKIASVLQ
jgi:glyceraldehyde 3-phosphate dehydrogenase